MYSWILRLASPAVLILLTTLAASSHAQFYKQATGPNALSGQYLAHDIFEIYDDRQELGRGFRTFNSTGLLNRLFTYPTATPLNFTIATDGTFRLFSSTFNGGFSGTVALGGELGVYSLESAPNADTLVRDGYASLQFSVRQGSNRRDSDFDGNYSYHGFLRTAADVYRTSFGVATSGGKGSYFVIRESTVLRTFNYGVESNGQIDLGPQSANDAALVAGGDLIVNTASVGIGDDGEIPGGYTGLVLYLRRFPDNDATLADFRGSYRVHQISATGSTTPRADLGVVTVGGHGYFFGDLGSAPYEGQIALNPSGTFTFVGTSAFQGTLGANGDVAVVTSKSPVRPALEIWVRIAGGAANSLDSDGDGLTDAEEDALGTDPELADTDGDGLLDNIDSRPTIADNVVAATLSTNAITLDEEATGTVALSLTLDSNNFPFFEWSLASSQAWLTIDGATGFGDGTVQLSIDPSTLASASSPYTANITLTAPAMKTVAPLQLTVTIASSQADLLVAPATLAFNVVEGGVASSQNLAISSPDGNDFTWTVATPPAWLTLSPQEGAGPGDIEVAINPETLTEANSPYETTLQFKPGGTGPKQATVDVTVTVLPPRDVDTPFPISDAEVAQTQPAVAFDPESERWVIAWLEDKQILAMLLDGNLTPLTTPRQLSLDVLGEAAHPTAVLVGEARELWVLWEQRTTVTSDGLLQARAFNADDLTLGNNFSFSTGAGDKSNPDGTFNATSNEVLITYNQEFEGKNFVGFSRIDSNVRSTTSNSFPAKNSNNQSKPVVDWLSDANQSLVVWREDFVNTDEANTTQIRAARIDGATGALLGDVIVVDDDARNGDHLQVVAAQGLNRWVLTWSERTLTNAPAVLHTTSISGGGDLGVVYTVDNALRAATPVALGYNEESKLLTLMWSRTPDNGSNRAVYQHCTGAGQPLGEPIDLPDNPASASTVAVGANPVLNEFLLVWEDPASIPRQLRALRIGGGSDDVDDDGLPNEWELQYGLNPNSAEGDDGPDGDPDNDELTNIAEFRLGTDPTDPDFDNDGLLDGQEDTNSDGMLEGRETNPLLADTDDDGVNDDVEWFLSSDGTDPESLPKSGIIRIDYGTWTIGSPGTLTASFYLAEAGSTAVLVNPTDTDPQNSAENWLLISEDDGSARPLEAGVHKIAYAIIPTANVTPTTAYGTFQFLLDVDSSPIDSRTTVLVVDLLEPYVEGTGGTAHDLAKTYAPVLRLHRDAIFTPIPVELTLNTATFDLGNTMTLPADPAPIDLRQSPYSEAYIDLPGEDTDALFAAYPEPELRPEPTIYYTVATLGDSSASSGAKPDYVSLQYYIHFYADVWGLDQTGGHRHEGDWEVFQVLIDQGLPLQATTTRQWQLAQVDSEVPGGESRPWDGIEVDGELRPILYVGQGSHSLNFEPGATTYPTANDVHDGLGFWMLPEDEGDLLTNPDYDKTLPMSLTPLRRLGESDTTTWLPFAGRWGQPNYPAPDSDSATPSVSSGPVGPAFMGTTRDPASETGVPRIWADPFLFAERMPDNHSEATSRVQGTLPEVFRGERILLMGPRGRIFEGPIGAETGSFDIEVPVQTYALAVIAYDATERPVLVAKVRFVAGATQTLLFPATEATTALGVFTESDGGLVNTHFYGTIDSDGDGMVDGEDGDMDNDGIDNASDEDMLGDGWDDRYQSQDRDKDGVPDFLDTDDDGDGLDDASDTDRNGNGIDDAEDPGDIDQDGFFDVVDLDQDNDTYDDATERAAQSDPRHFLDTPLSQVGDLDRDGDVDVVDGQQLVNQALVRDTYNPRADYNLNGIIDASDLQSLVHDILNVVP